MPDTNTLRCRASGASHGLRPIARISLFMATLGIVGGVAVQTPGPSVRVMGVGVTEGGSGVINRGAAFVRDR